MFSALFTCAFLLISSKVCSAQLLTTPATDDDDGDSHEKVSVDCTGLSNCIKEIVENDPQCNCSQLQVAKLYDMISCVYGKDIPDRCPSSSKICINDAKEDCESAQEKCYEQYYGSTTEAQDAAEANAEDQCEKDLSSKYPSLVRPDHK